MLESREDMATNVWISVLIRYLITNGNSSYLVFSKDKKKSFIWTHMKALNKLSLLIGIFILLIICLWEVYEVSYTEQVLNK